MGPGVLLLAAQALVQGGGAAPPVLEFPDPALDDPARYQGYTTRVYRDAAGTALQIYVDARDGRVVHLWADAANESAGFTARDGAGRPVALAWASGEAVTGGADGRRFLEHRLSAGSGPLRLGHFLLGSMRVERDFQYSGGHRRPFDAPPFVPGEFTGLVASLERLPAEERRRHLELLDAREVADLRARLVPRLTLDHSETAWLLRVEQVTLDGRNRLTLELRGDPRAAEVALAGRELTVRPRGGGPVTIVVRVTTDAAALTPLGRETIFNDAFRRYHAAARADTAHPERFRRIERQVRGVELVSYREKLMAGLPNFATYFGRDMLMTALLMEPVWSDTMPEYVIAAALRKLSPTGEVSHEEALGGQAIREHAAEYSGLVAAFVERRDTAALRRARELLGDLQRVRENYRMVDDDLQLPVVAARYLGNSRVPAGRRRAFLAAEDRLPRLVRHLGFVARQLEPYVRDPRPTNLVSFLPDPGGGRGGGGGGGWMSGSWRDSRAGYGGGRFAMDVNVVWAPAALAAVGDILTALGDLGLAAGVEDLPEYVRDPARRARALQTWRGAERHFAVVLPTSEARRRAAARIAVLPEVERRHWERVLAATPLSDVLRFQALSLDGAGRPIAVANTDPAMLLLTGSPPPERVAELLEVILLPYPLGLFAEGLGPLVANDAYAPERVWEQFRADLYHSPRVAWGREVNVLLAGLAGRADAPARSAVRRIRDAVERAGLGQQELWTYEITVAGLRPVRYGTSSDVQLWNLTDLAVQFLLAGGR